MSMRRFSHDSKFFDQQSESVVDECNEEVEINLSLLEDKIVNYDINNDLAPSFVTEQLCYVLCQLVKPIFAHEPVIVPMTRPVTVVGDIHGQFSDLVRMMDDFGVPPHNPVLFLGDYVDRGPSSIMVICTLFLLKVRYPTQFILLRGNHEFKSVNKRYGFINECYTSFSHHAVYDCFNSVFSYMPLAAVIDNQFFCCHGGISQNLLKSSTNSIIDAVSVIKRPIQTLKNHRTETDLMWSDPYDERIDGPGQILPAFLESKRGISFKFNCAALEAFLRKYSLKALIRAHQVMKHGIGATHKNKCITIFSASGYPSSKAQDNYGAIATLPNTEFDDIAKYMKVCRYEPFNKKENRKFG